MRSPNRVRSNKRLMADIEDTLYYITTSRNGQVKFVKVVHKKLTIISVT